MFRLGQSGAGRTDSAGIMQRCKAIEAIHKFGYDDAKLELATMQLELQIMKQDGGSHETADDGFMDAMNATASEVWGDQDV